MSQMSMKTATPCALGVGDRTLSDFRSDGLGAREMEQLRTHVAQCPACQRRLAQYESIAQALKGQPELQGHAQLWQNVRASIAASASPAPVRRGRSQRAGRSRSMQVWTTVGSIAAVLALSIGFVALFRSQGARPPATKTATPITIHSGSLTWRQVIVPKGFPGADQANDSATNSGALIAPSDGKTAYACQADTRKVAAPVVWATHDAGAHWSVITPSDLPANTQGCRIILDANDASALIVSVYPILRPDQPALPNTWTTYASFDGGATWSKPTGLQDGAVTMAQASAHGKVYADRGIADAAGNLDTGLYVSGDQMRTWRRIDTTLPEAAPNPPNIHDTGKVFQMWVNPASGAVMIETYTNTLWSTLDDGAHWTKIAYPNGVYTDGDHAPILMIGAPAASGHLTICGSFTPLGSESEQWLTCTSDGRTTWVKRPDLTTVGAEAGNLAVASIGMDGSIYAVRLAPPAHPGDGNEMLYRLPPYATTAAAWQPLGEIPDSQHGGGYQIVTAGQQTVFWVFPGVTTTTDSADHSTTTTQPYYYVATYP